MDVEVVRGDVRVLMWDQDPYRDIYETDSIHFEVQRPTSESVRVAGFDCWEAIDNGCYSTMIPKDTRSVCSSSSGNSSWTGSMTS